MSRVIFLFLVLFSNNIFAHGSSHPERHTHYVEYFYDLDNNAYMEIYDCRVVVSMVDVIHLKSGYYKSNYILPSESKRLMLTIPQNTSYTGYLSIVNGCVVDSKNIALICDLDIVKMMTHSCSVN